MNKHTMKFVDNMWYIGDIDIDTWLSEKVQDVRNLPSYKDGYGIKRFSEYLKDATTFWDMNIIKAWMNMYIDACATVLYNHIWNVTDGNDRVKEREAIRVTTEFEKRFK